MARCRIANSLHEHALFCEKRDERKKERDGEETNPSKPCRRNSAEASPMRLVLRQPHDHGQNGQGDEASS